MSRPRPWRIAIRAEPDVVFVGIPDRLGEAWDHRDPGNTTLEEVAGEGWSRTLLSQLLPGSLAWAWWTRTEVFEGSRLPRSKAPSALRPADLSVPLSRSLLFRRMTLAMIPPAEVHQQPVLEWAGQDTEQVADLLWTAADPRREWRTRELVAWCLDGTFRQSPRVVLHQAAERVLVIHDSHVRCALSPGAADVAREKLRALAEKWGIDLAPGPAESAW